MAYAPLNDNLAQQVLYKASPVGEVSKISLIFDEGVYGGSLLIICPSTPQSPSVTAPLQGSRLRGTLLVR